MCGAKYIFGEWRYKGNNFEAAVHHTWIKPTIVLYPPVDINSEEVLSYLQEETPPGRGWKRCSFISKKFGSGRFIAM